MRSGNLSQAQSDFPLLQQYLPSGQSSAATSAASSQNSNPLLAAVNQLGQDLKSGNLSAAQSDFATVQQDVQQIAQQQSAGDAHRHHHHHSTDSDSQTSSQQTPVSTLFNELGTSLQSGNLTTAQQAYSTLQQDFQRFALGGCSSTSSSSASAGASGLSVSEQYLIPPERRDRHARLPLSLFSRYLLGLVVAHVQS